MHRCDQPGANVRLRRSTLVRSEHVRSTVAMSILVPPACISARASARAGGGSIGNRDGMRGSLVYWMRQRRQPFRNTVVMLVAARAIHKTHRETAPNIVLITPQVSHPELSSSGESPARAPTCGCGATIDVVCRLRRRFEESARARNPHRRMQTPLAGTSSSAMACMMRALLVPTRARRAPGSLQVVV